MLLTPGVIAGAPLVPRLINHPFRCEREREREDERALVSVKEKVEEIDTRRFFRSCSSSWQHGADRFHSGNILKINLY